MVYRELDRVRVKGKGQAVSIYEPVGLPGQVDEQQLERIKQFQQMLSHYRAQQWEEVLSTLQLLPGEDEVLVRLYTGRIAEIRKNLPGPEWDGVTSFATK